VDRFCQKWTKWSGLLTESHRTVGFDFSVVVVDDSVRTEASQQHRESAFQADEKGFLGALPIIADSVYLGLSEGRQPPGPSVHATLIRVVDFAWSDGFRLPKRLPSLAEAEHSVQSVCQSFDISHSRYHLA
jgi:hypothetical protein